MNGLRGEVTWLRSHSRLVSGVTHLGKPSLGLPKSFHMCNYLIPKGTFWLSGTVRNTKEILREVPTHGLI